MRKRPCPALRSARECENADQTEMCVRTQNQMLNRRLRGLGIDPVNGQADALRRILRPAAPRGMTQDQDRADKDTLPTRRRCMTHP